MYTYSSTQKRENFKEEIQQYKTVFFVFFVFQGKSPYK